MKIYLVTEIDCGTMKRRNDVLLLKIASRVIS